MSNADRSETFNAATVFIDRHLDEGRGGDVVFRYEGRSVTYGELAADVNRAGNAFGCLGVEIENRVLLALHDRPAFAAAFWGAAKIGAVAIPINPFMEPAEYEFVLNDSRAKVAVVDEEVAPKILAVRHNCPWVRSILVAGLSPAGTLAWRNVLEAASDRLVPVSTRGEDLLYWGYTSGSTGEPKAAVHSHEHFVSAARLVGVGVFGVGRADRVFSGSKMYFGFGLGNTLIFPAYVGAASLLIPERLGPERAFEVITAERPTIFFTVPTLYGRMLQVPDARRKYDLSSLRLCVSSGEALPPVIFDAWRERFGLELLDVFGSTETLHDFIANRPGLVRRGSVGQVIPGFEARLVDNSGQPAPIGDVGHLLIKGPTNAPFYWNRLARTRTTMLGEWLRTGDMMWQDDQGYFYFAGRSDDMLKVSGQWVSPAEIEGALSDHPDVLDAAVVGRAQGDGLMRPHAFIVLKPGASPSALELLAFARTRLAAYKVPHSIEFVGELPRTSTGKIQRFRLRTASSQR